MERTYIKDIKVGETNKVKGFIENIRDKKTMAFIVVRDITGKLQVTIEKEKFPEIAKEIEENPEEVLKSPQTTPIKKVDETLAARQPNLTFNG